MCRRRCRRRRHRRWCRARAAAGDTAALEDAEIVRGESRRFVHHAAGRHLDKLAPGRVRAEDEPVARLFSGGTRNLDGTAIVASRGVPVAGLKAQEPCKKGGFKVQALFLLEGLRIQGFGVQGLGFRVYI